MSKKCKTQIQFIMKTFKIIIPYFVILISLFAACTSNTNSKNEGQTKVEQTSVKPPKMDIISAAFMGDLKAVRQHIQAGSDLNVKDEYGSSPLAIATTFGKTEVALALIEGGADINATSSDGSSPLHTASFFCRTEIVKALIEKGADKSIRNNYGSTALESASVPFEHMKTIYDQISKDLGPLGLKLDYEYLEKTRPVIAEMLK